MSDSPRADEPTAEVSSESTGFNLALVHYPVFNRLGEVIASTVDSFDFFDASRLALTYGVDRLYIVHPEPAQQALVSRLIAHGQSEGRKDNERGHFSRSLGVHTLQDAIDDVTKRCGCAPRTVATTAQGGRPQTPLAQLRSELSPSCPQLWLIGKAWGMTPQLLDSASDIAASIDAKRGYNHLSVRSALAIYIDRMLAVRPF